MFNLGKDHSLEMEESHQRHGYLIRQPTRARSIKSLAPGQQLMMNYAAMQQRVRTEAGNIAALQAQATNAAQEAVKQAMVRHAAASTAAKAKKEMPTAGMPPGVVIQRSS